MDAELDLNRFGWEAHDIVIVQPRHAALTSLRLAARKPAPVIALPPQTAEEAQQWIEDYITERVDQIGEDTEEAVMELIDAAVAGDLTPQVTALLLEQSIGLTSQMTGSLQGTVEELEDAEDGDVVDVGTGALRIPVGGITASLLAGVVTTLGAKYLANRISTNARNDPFTASSQGQRDVWQDAADEGLFDPDTAFKYIVGGDPCPICLAVIQKGPIPFADYYDVEDGYNLEPPFHPNCECVEVLDTGGEIVDEDL